VRYQPQRWLERLSTSVLPPGSREHVLGDLVECSGSRNDYLRNLASALPCVIVCQIRRRVSKGVVIFNAIASAIALIVGPKPPAFGTPADWIGLTVPWAIWVAGCVLAAAYGPAGNPGRSSHKVLAATYVAAVALAALVGVPITAVAVGFGVLIGLILVLSMPWLQTEKLLQPLSIETLPDQARAFQKTIWWRNAREMAAALIVLTANVPDLWRGENMSDRASHGLLIAGTLFIMYYLRFRAGARQVPSDADARGVLRFHRAELVRQRDILRDVHRWYLLPFLPGILVGMVSKWGSGASTLLTLAMMFASLCVMFYLIWRLNLWAATWLDGQVKQADVLNEQLP
jgi:hypothetical protein